MSDPVVVTAIVLAGGTSSRFGGDKLAADLDGVPVLHRTLRAMAATADEIVLVLAPHAPVPALPPELSGRVSIARDAQALGGPLAGLAAGLDAVRDDAPRIALVVGGDMPWLVPAVVRLLAERLASEAGLVAMTLDASVVAPPPPAMTLGASDLAPLPMAVRPSAAREAVAGCLAGRRRSLRSLLDAVPSGILPAADWRTLDPPAATLRDVDLPADLGAR